MTPAAIQERSGDGPRTQCKTITIKPNGDFDQCGIQKGDCIDFNTTSYLKPGETAYLYCSVSKTPLRRKKITGTGGGTIVIGG